MRKQEEMHASDQKNNIILIFLLYFFYSTIGIIAKYNALTSQIGSFRFLLLLGIELGFLGLFTLGWQYLLKKFELSYVYLFKGTTILWGLLFAKVFFHEVITTTNILGSMIIMIGIGVILNE